MHAWLSVEFHCRRSANQSLCVSVPTGTRTRTTSRKKYVGHVRLRSFGAGSVRRVRLEVHHGDQIPAKSAEVKLLDQFVFVGRRDHTKKTQCPMFAATTRNQNVQTAERAKLGADHTQSSFEADDIGTLPQSFERFARAV
jgi:hypothetical protein